MILTLNGLANSCIAAGRFSQGIQHYEQAAVDLEKIKFQHPNATLILRNLISALERVKQWDKAEIWHRKCLTNLQSQLGRNHLDCFAQISALGLNLLEQKKWADAENLLREMLAWQRKNQPEFWTTFNTQSLLGRVLWGQKNYKEAQEHLLAGYEGMRLRWLTIPPQGRHRLAEAVDRLIDLFEALKQSAEVKRWQLERSKYPYILPRPTAEP
jgi:tetratricopeptide (TPR) repeat protein